ncbi:B54 [miniopterid betaherpesvirus 1]|uniref:DNA polymerase n=1 Tax=miniopterid betaherpesvirus 1 TaxID=3070189 RepID=I3VQ41_9BETA|nr:B54 [miniopterid betaherpesvirus 1]AFK83885.1 B54 [miniopterid betaherpesvirus 1]
MEPRVFYNPYLCVGAKRCESRQGPWGGGERRAVPGERAQDSFLRIVPRGVMYDGEPGLIKQISHLRPRMFYNNKEYLLSKGMAWPGLDVLPSMSFPSSGMGDWQQGSLVFHTYDQVDTLVFADATEPLYAGYRHHVIPAGTVLRLFGVLESGDSVCVNVFGQLCYFYCEYPDPDDLRAVIYTMASDVTEPKTPFSVNVKKVKRYSVYGYNTTEIRDLNLVCFTNWSMCKKVTAALMDAGYRVYEASADPLTRFFTDRKILPFGWCSLRRYHVRRKPWVSSAMFEIDCEVGDVSAIAQENRWPCYKCLSFDIECMSGSGAFPVAERLEDMVIQISCVCYTVGDRRDGVSQRCDLQPRQHLFTVGPCDPIPGVCVYEFPSEFEMLMGFFIFFKRYGPEFVTGYNINSFDVRYILTRVEKVYRINVDHFTKLSYGGRMYAYLPQSARLRYGSSVHTKVFITGSVVIDMYPVCMAKVSAQNYKLNTMADYYLGQRKDDLSYKEIPKEFIRNSEGRARVGKYCVQDAALVRDLFERINYHYEAAAVARLARIPMRKVIFEGQQVRVYTCILEEAAARNMVLPSFPRKGASTGAVEDGSGEGIGSEEPATREGDGRVCGYQGATVFEPDIGYFDTPVTVFDFASLYPSIIMAHNICYCTLVTDDRADSMNVDDLFCVDLGDGVCHRFVKESVRRSIMSELLGKWLTQRRLVREAMRECADPVRRLLLDKEQAALKVTCNAFYGFTGVASGMMPCLPIAASITRIGRDMLSKTANYIHSNLSDRAGLGTFFADTDFIPDERVAVRVIYGDTDSVFVNTRGVRTDALIRSAPDIAAHITCALFREPVKLEFEKTFASLMMICKKRYIGRVHGSSALTMKGVELVRKTACDFVKRVVREILERLFNDPEVSAAAVRLSEMSMEELRKDGLPSGFYPIIGILCDARDKLHLNGVNVKDLVFSTVLSQEVSMYKQKNLPHLAVIRRLAARSEELPSVGDRVQYVLTAGSEAERRTPNYELAEDPDYVAEHNVPIHAEKYFEHIVKAVTHAMSPIFPKDLPKKERFFSYVLPRRVYLEAAFMRNSCKDRELVC